LLAAEEETLDRLLHRFASAVLVEEHRSSLVAVRRPESIKRSMAGALAPM